MGLSWDSTARIDSQDWDLTAELTARIDSRTVWDWLLQTKVQLRQLTIDPVDFEQLVRKCDKFELQLQNAQEENRSQKLRADTTQKQLAQVASPLPCTTAAASLILAHSCSFLLLLLLSLSHTHIHSLSLVLVVMMESKELKTKISHAHSLIHSHSHSHSPFPSLLLLLWLWLWQCY